MRTDVYIEEVLNTFRAHLAKFCSDDNIEKSRTNTVTFTNCTSPLCVSLLTKQLSNRTLMTPGHFYHTDFIIFAHFEVD